MARGRQKSPEFRTCSSGATLIVVALSLTLLLITLGIVVDMSRMYAVHSKAQNAADAALLGAVATIDTNPPAADGSDKLTAEVIRLFDANYPSDYMGSHVDSISVTNNNGPGIYDLTFTVSMPMVILQYFGETATTFNVVSQVTRGFDEAQSNSLELALVLDNTASMGAPLSKMEGLKQASRDLVDILFGEKTTSDKINISVVPYNIAVNIGTNHDNWMQGFDDADTAESKYYGYTMYHWGVLKYNRGLAANRQWDHWCGPRPIYGCWGATTCPIPDPCDVSTRQWICKHQTPDPETGAARPDACGWSCYPCTPSPARCTAFSGTPLYWDEYGGQGQTCLSDEAHYTNYSGLPNNSAEGYNYSDLTDDPPTTPATKFRLYWANAPFAGILGNNAYSNYLADPLTQILFGSNSKDDIKAVLETMTPTDQTRIPIGLMWGWFTLSPKWRGGDGWGVADLPKDPSTRLDKVLVLMTDGKNVRIPAVSGWYTGDRLDDDKKTAALCEAIKQQGIAIYTVGFGNEELDETLLQNCATTSSYYFKAPTAETLQTAFHAIADDILYNTLRLSK